MQKAAVITIRNAVYRFELAFTSKKFSGFFFYSVTFPPPSYPFKKKRTGISLPHKKTKKKNVPYSYIIGLGYLIGSLLLLVEAGGTL